MVVMMMQLWKRWCFGTRRNFQREGGGGEEVVESGFVGGWLLFLVVHVVGITFDPALEASKFPS